MLYAADFSCTDRDQLSHCCFLKYLFIIFRHVAEIDIRFCTPVGANTLYPPNVGLSISIATDPHLSSGTFGSSHDIHILSGKTHGTNPNGRHHSASSARASSSVCLFLTTKRLCHEKRRPKPPFPMNIESTYYFFCLTYILQIHGSPIFFSLTKSSQWHLVPSPFGWHGQ